MTPDRHLGWVTHCCLIYLILDSYINRLLILVLQCCMDRQVSSRHPHLWIYVCHHNPWLKEMQREGLSEESAWNHWKRRQGEKYSQLNELYDVFFFLLSSSSLTYWHTSSLVFYIFCVFSCFQVLIPVFALGRAQELCILLETFWYFGIWF